LDDTGLITIQNNTKERLLFCKLDFINAEQYDNFEDGHSYISLGATSDNSTDKLVVRDLYKVLVNKPVTELSGDIKIRLYYMTGDCKIVPLKSGDVSTAITATINELNFMNLIIEYEEMD
jgi:hypothetical protein